MVTPVQPTSGIPHAAASAPRVECPACGETMVDTGKRETSKVTRQPMRIMSCPHCGNEAGVSVSTGRPATPARPSKR